MPKWNEITVTDKYKSLPPQAQAEVKTEWFKANLLPEVEKRDSLREMGADKVYEWFMQQPDDTGEGIVRSTLGSAVRGFGEIIPGTLEGVGALTGITPISDLGASAREGLEYIAPVNPIYEQGIPAKVANVAGNVASIIGTSGVGGLAGKALGAERAAAAGSAAARQALTNQAIQAGAKSALYGTGFAQGAAAKAAENERLGITGAEGYLNLLGGGISELAPEMLPFGSALETSTARRLLGGVDDAAGRVIPGIRMSAAQEAAEGGSTQVLSNLSTQLTAPTGVETPGLFEGAGEAALWEGIGGAMFGAINKLGRTPPERQTAEQKAYAAELGAVPVDSKPPITPEESLENFNQGGIPVVSPDGVVTTLPFNREDIRATNLPFNRDDIRATDLPFSREDIRPTQLPFNREDIRATELPFSRQNIRGLSQLGQPVPSPSQVIADTLLTNAVNVSSDATKATEAALAVVQGVAATAPVELPVPTVEPTVETPSPAMEQIEMPVPPPTAEAGAGVGEAPVSRPTSGRKPVLAPQVQEMLAKAAAINAGTQTVAPSTNEFVQKMTGQTPAKPSEDKIKRLTDDLAFSGVGEIDGVRYAIQASPDGTFYVQKTTNGVREALALGQPDISTANQVAIQIASNEYQDVSESSKAKEPAAKSQASESVGSDKEAKAGYGGMSVEEAKAYLNRPGQILGFDEPSFLDSQRQKGKIKPAPPITPTKETPTPATEGTVMPGGSAMERDVTKPEQMTPEEFDAAIQSVNRKTSDKNTIEDLKIAEPIIEMLDNATQPGPEMGGRGPTPQIRKMLQDAGYVERAKAKRGRLTEKGRNELSELKKSVSGFQDKRANLQDEIADNLPVSAVAVDAYGIPLPSGYVKQGDLYVFSPQTTTVATPTETAAPLAKEAAVASVVQQPAEGSIPAVEQESATTAIESNEKADIADAAMAFLEEDLTESKRQWSPEKIAAAKAYFASGGKDMDVLRAAFPKLVGSRPIVQAYLKADKEASEAQAKRDAADAKLAKEIERDEKEQAKAEAAQKKREELNLKTLNSLIQKTRTNVVQGTVKATDANQAVAILNRSGEIPNVLFTWIGTSKDFLADPANRVRYPETWAAVSADSKIEGMSENGQPIVFTDNVGVSDLDRKLANLQGTTPEVAAVRRVILHENIHKGMFFLSMKEKMQIFSFLRRMYSPQELDSLAESYSEYSDWRTNQVSYFSILEEAMTRDFDSMVEIPRDGILAEFMQFLRGIWQKITGKTSEPTLKDYKDVFRLIRNSLKNSEKANADMLVNGGGVRMSMSEFLSNVTPEQDAEYMAAVEAGDVARQQAMVDAAAKAAGGIKVWHGGNIEGSVIDTDRRERGAITERRPGTFYGSTSEKVANTYPGKTNSMFFFLKNPFRISTPAMRPASWTGETAVKTGKGVANRKSSLSMGEAIDRAKTNGYDGVVYENIIDVGRNFAALTPPVASTVVAFDPNQIKSADPITRDEQGNVIPLSRRFQAASNDIRFSKVEYDSPNDAAFNSGAEVARNTDYDERDKEVRSTIRAAYDIAPKTNGPSVPLDELFSIVQQSMPDVTETEFSRILQGLYEDSGALLIEGESPFATFTTEGERAGSAIIMPPTDMTKDDVISMLRGMSAANPAPSGGINQELYDTVLTQLRNFISNGGRIPLPIQSYGATKAGRYNYTRQKDGLERDLRQGSGIGGTGQIDTGASFRDKVERENLEIQRIDSEVSRNRETTTEGRENRKREAGARHGNGKWWLHFCRLCSNCVQNWSKSSGSF